VELNTNLVFMHIPSQNFLKISTPSLDDGTFQYKLKLTSTISDKCIFKIVPSNKLQQESNGEIHMKDKIHIAYAYDKIMSKDIYLYADTQKLECDNPLEGCNRKLIFSEDNKVLLSFSPCHGLDYERSENFLKDLNNKFIQIRHVESEMYLAISTRKKQLPALNRKKCSIRA